MRFALVRTLSLFGAAAALAPALAFAADPYASAPAYLKPVTGLASVRPLVTTGQQIPRAGGGTYRFLGIPDGLGVSGGNGSLTLFNNHEFTQAAGGPDGPINSGARVGQLTLTYSPALPFSTVQVTDGKLAFSRIFQGDVPTLVAPNTKTMTRFCSAFLAGPQVGFDRSVFLTGEESNGAATFGGQGGSAFATVDGDLYQLPRFGLGAWENWIVAPGTGASTVVFGDEDGSSSGTGLNSQVYMYLGTKQPGASDALSINGLNNGALYVLAADDASKNDESKFTVKGASTPVHFAPVNWNQTDTQLDTQSRSVGSFLFVRVEDGAFDPVHPGVFYFVTTGKPGSANPYGRLYRLTFDPQNPVGAATLTLLLDGSEGFVSPDNIDVNARGQIAICEDPNYNLTTLGRAFDTSVWIYDIPSGFLTRVLEMDRASAVAHALAADPLNTDVAAEDFAGNWEDSGVISAEPWLGRGSWLIDVQAHSLRINPSSETVEGGQILAFTYDDSLATSARDTDQGTVTPSSQPVQLAVASATPAAGRVTLRYSLPTPAPVQLVVLDARGGVVATLQDGMQQAGVHAVSWNSLGSRAASSGVYFAQLKTGREVRTTAFTVVK